MTEQKIFDIIEKNRKKGMLVVISAPSGTGKTTLCRMLVSDMERAVYSISVTSRMPRPGEIDGKDYFFVEEQEFQRRIKDNELLEWAQVYDNYYGTSKEFVEKNLNQGKYIILDIDVQGGLQIKEKYPHAVLVFVVPPSREELKKRLVNRKQDSQAEIEKRLRNAEKEMEYGLKYGYLVLNEELETALKQLKSIVFAEKNRL